MTNRFKKLIHKKTTTSTNNYALNYVKSNNEEVIVVSDEQTGGERQLLLNYEIKIYKECKSRMQYFKNCDCIEELKKQYRELCFKYHPGISKEANVNEIMKKVNSE